MSMARCLLVVVQAFQPAFLSICRPFGTLRTGWKACTTMLSQSSRSRDRLTQVDDHPRNGSPRGQFREVYILRHRRLALADQFFGGVLVLRILLQVLLEQ